MDSYAREKLYQQYRLSKDMFSMLVNICVATSQIKGLKIPFMDRLLRGNLHLLIFGNRGLGKSSVLWEITKALDIVPEQSLTKANLYGTVDKQSGLLNPPAIWEHRNSILAIDEYEYNNKSPADREVLRAFISLLENPHFKKRIGYRCNESEEKDKDLYLKVERTGIEIKTRFSLMMTTMHNPLIMKSQSFRALIDRCLVLPYTINLFDMNYSIKGETRFEYEHLNVRKGIIEISKKDYIYVVDYCRDKLTDDEVGIYLRMVGDCLRAFAVLKEHNTVVYDYIIAFKRIYYMEDKMF